MGSTKEYWASVPREEIAQNILDQKDKFYQYLTLSGRALLYLRSKSMYYRARVTGGSMGSGGSSGELSTLVVNQFKNILQHLEALTFQQKPAWDPKATNSDVKSVAQTILAKGLLDYEADTKGLSKNLRNAVKGSLMYGEEFVLADWNHSAGEIYGETETGSPIYQGDIRYKNVLVFNMIRDFQLSSPTEEVWWIIRDFQNKYDLAAKYPEIAEDIISASRGNNDNTNLLLSASQIKDPDVVVVYTLIHKPTPSMPTGRYTQVLDNSTVLLDGPVPEVFDRVHRISAGEETGTIFGDTIAFDLQSIQDGIDTLNGVIITNQSTFGVQSILAPKGHDLSVSSLASGLNLIEYDTNLGPIQPLQLTSTPVEVFNHLGTLESNMEAISGVNSVVRGDPQASLKSGSALALVQAQAVTFSAPLQDSFATLMSEIGTTIIKLYQTYASVPRVALIAGKSNRSLLKEFTGDELSLIERVVVTIANPLSKSPQGRATMAQELSQMGLVKQPEDYFQVLETGTLEPILTGPRAQAMLIKAENEKLADGIPVRALITDQHLKHISEHQTVLASPEAREQPDGPLVVNTLNHIQEHIDFLTNPANATLLTTLGQSPMAPPVVEPSADAQNITDPTNPVVRTAENVAMPNMPNPPANATPEVAGTIQEQNAIAQ